MMFSSSRLSMNCCTWQTASVLMIIMIMVTRMLLLKKSYLNFHPIEVVSRYRDPQLQVGENYIYLFNLRSILSGKS